MAHWIVKREVIKDINLSISIIKTQKKPSQRYRVNQVDMDSNQNIETRFFPENMYKNAIDYYNKLLIINLDDKKSIIDDKLDNARF